MNAEEELKSLYDAIGLNYNYHKGSSTMLVNIKNMHRRTQCLGLIENYLTYTEECEDTGELFEEQLLNWGECPNDYIERFKKIVPNWNKDSD